MVASQSTLNFPLLPPVEAPTTTRAWQITRRGCLPDTLRLAEVAIPKPRACEVQVRVKYAALNPVDAQLAALYPSFIQELPRTAASDFSAVIMAVGPGTQPHWARRGTRVYGFFSPDTSFRDQKGSLQEIITIPSRFIQPTPDDYTDEDVAGVTLVGLAALALTDSVRSGDRVVIIGGSTAVGLLAADIALSKGASYIVATASGTKARLVRNRGVDDTIDYHKMNAGDELAHRYQKKPFDLIIDCIGQRSIHAKCARFLKPSGTYLSLAAATLTARKVFNTPEAREAFASNFDPTKLPSFHAGVPRTFKQVSLDDSRMEELGRLVDSGVLHPVADREFTFDEVPRAYKYLMEGGACGKVLVQVAPDQV